MTAPTAFNPRPHRAGGQGFTPMAGLSMGSAGFVRHAPQDLLQKTVPDTPVPVVPDPEPVAPPVAPPPATAARSTALSDQARAQLLADAHAKGRAEALAELAPQIAALDHAAALLRQVLDGISIAMDSETEALANTLGHLVRSLASERAGSQIDHDPAGFAARVNALSMRISNGLAGVSVVLNPQDLAALRAVVCSDAPQLVQLLQADLHSDAALARGDVRLRAPGLTLDDLIFAAGAAV